MNELIENIEKYLKNKKIETRWEVDHEMREIVQCIVLSELSKTDFFDNNTFQGGTALKLLYGLNRYSRDLDFTLNENNNFSWEKYINVINSNLEKYDISFNYKDESKNNIFRCYIKEDSILKNFAGKNIVPKECTKKNTRKKTEIMLETSFNINSFNSEYKEIMFPNKYSVKVYDIHSLFAGKIHACLTREKTDKITKEKIMTEEGRDWFDLVWYINNKIKPNYDFLYDKINKINVLKEMNLKVDDKLIKELLLERIKKLNYDKINNDIKEITKPEDKIILNENILLEKINQI